MPSKLNRDLELFVRDVLMSSADPQNLGPYRIVRRIGAGGMGEVYEAVHTGLDKRVALKVLPRELAAKRLERFLREARTAAGLHHTNIVPVFDVGQVDGVPYYAMQYIDGRPLGSPSGPQAETHNVPLDPATLTHEPQRSGTKTFAGGTATVDHADGGVAPVPFLGRLTPPARLDPRVVVGHVLQAAEGLAYAHERGVVHRDIKPSNLLLDSEGVVWVADFGLAFRADDPTLTADGAILGTPRYMSPEQARADRTDPRTDVYSLGVTLYELLTGSVAFPGDTPMGVIRKVLEDTPPRPRDVNHAIPRDLETVVIKAMAKRPEDRYATGREFADDLKRFLNGEPVQARRVTIFGKALRWSKRNPAVTALLAVVLVVFAAGTGVSAYFARQAELREREAKRNEGLAIGNALDAKFREVEATDAKNKALASEKSNRRLLYASRMNLAGIALREGRYNRVSELLADTYPHPGEEDLRGWEWHYLFRVAHSHSRAVQLPLDGGPHAFDATQIVLCDLDNEERNITSRVYDTSTGNLLFTKHGPTSSGTPLNWGREGLWWGDTGRFLFRKHDDVFVWDVSTGKETSRLPAPEGGRDFFGLHTTLPAALSADGTRYARIVADPAAPANMEGNPPAAIEVLEVATQKQLRILKPPEGFGAVERSRDVKFSPDGRWLGVLDTGSRFAVWDLTDGTIRVFRGSPGGQQILDSGNRFAFGTGRVVVPAMDDRSVEVYDLTVAEPKPTTLAGPGANVVACAFDADSRRLAVAYLNAIRLFDLAGQAPPQEFKTFGMTLTQIGFRPDGRRLFVLGLGMSRASGKGVGSNSLQSWVKDSPNLVREWELDRPAHRRIPDDATTWSRRAVVSPAGDRVLLERVQRSPRKKTLAVGDDWQPWLNVLVDEVENRLAVLEIREIDRPERSVPLTAVGESITIDITPAWAPDGTHVAAVIDSRSVASLVGAFATAISPQVIVCDTANGRRRHTFSSHVGPPHAIRYSPCAGYVAIEGPAGAELFDIASGRSSVAYAPPHGRRSEFGIAFLANPTRLAVVHEAIAIPGVAVECWNPATGEKSATGDSTGTLSGMIRTSVDGHSLAFRVMDREKKSSHMMVLDASGSRPIWAAACPLSSVADSGSGYSYLWSDRWLAVTNGRAVHLIERGTWQPGPVFIGEDGDAASVAFTPDGRRALVRYHLGGVIQRITIWDVETAQQLVTLAVGSSFRHAAPSPHFDGKLYSFARGGQTGEFEWESLDGSPVPDAVARERLGIK